MSLLDKLAIQLWSVRDVTSIDYVGTLKKLAEMGYTGVEFAGYGGLSAKEMQVVLAANGLKSVGAHVGLERLTQNLDEEIEYNKTLGTEYIVCPSSKIKNREDVLQLTETLKPIIGKISDAGLKFAYHNHAFEFEKSDDEYLLDILFETLPAEAVMELDVYWVAYADVDPFAYMEKHKDRLKLIHIKQIGEGKHNVDVEKGFIDFKKIIVKAKEYGIQHFILEQEEYEVSSMVSTRKNIDYIKKLE
jgi:sugar phosphate isomerase/epimerase